MSAPTTGWITFRQNRLPALMAGEYDVNVSLHVKNDDPTAQNPDDQAYLDHTYDQKKKFAVYGHRFSMPPDQLHSVFPPDESQGEFDDVLAHVVLTNPTMPWQRSALAVSTITRTTGSVPDGSDGMPWLALLVFHAADKVPDAVTAKVGDLQREPFAADPDSAAKRASTLPDTAATYPNLTLDYGEAYSQNCRVIDIPVDVFSSVVPALVDLPWLAHDRTITPTLPSSVEDTASSSGVPTYSVVVANRLPKDDDEATVHLVSLENMSDLLPTIGAGGHYEPADITVAGGPDDGKPAASVRLVTLKTWTFTPVEPKETFDGYLEHVDAAPLQLPGFSPTSPAEQAVSTAFDMGFTALEHHTRLGDRTVSWLRGPFVPYDVGAQVDVPIPDPTAGAGPITSADAAVRYDPTTAMFDESIAAAWQIGRLLALQNTSFATALYDWKRAAARKTVLALEREYLTGRLGETLPAIGEHTDSSAVAHEVMRLFAARLAPAVGLDGSSGEASAPGRLRQRAGLHERHQAVLADPAALETIHADSEPPAAVTDWLHRLARFYGVPFNYLVPDEGMLPTESIRFFRVDPTWIVALLEGALSLGSSTAGDAAHNAVLHPQARAAVTTAAGMSGLLLRSGAVAGWPKMHVNAYDVHNEPLSPIRVEPLSPTILLALFEGTVDTIDLMEPPIGLHFGVQPNGPDKELRWVTIPTVPVTPPPPENAQPGEQIVGTSAGAVAMRADGYTVAVSTRAAAVDSALNDANANLQLGTTKPRPFTTAEFALQLVEGIQEFRFVRITTDPETAP